MSEHRKWRRFSNLHVSWFTTPITQISSSRYRDRSPSFKLQTRAAQEKKILHHTELNLASHSNREVLLREKIFLVPFRGERRMIGRDGDKLVKKHSVCQCLNNSPSQQIAHTGGDDVNGRDLTPSHLSLSLPPVHTVLQTLLHPHLEISIGSTFGQKGRILREWIRHPLKGGPTSPLA